MIENGTVEHPEHQQLLRSAWSRTLALLGVWAIPALVLAGLTHVRLQQIGEPTSFWAWVGGQLAFWWIWAALTPLIIWLAKHFRIDRSPRTRSVLVHTILSILLGAGQLCLAAFISIRLHGEPTTWAYYVGEVVPYLMWRGPWAALTYWAVLGVVYAFDYNRALRDREVQAARLEAQIARARLDTLQRQLQPHFLFNTLNSIAVQIRGNRPSDADAMVGHLSEMLRYVLTHEHSHVTTLSDELRFTERYVQIEKIRHGERLSVQFDVATDVQRALVPAFMLQALVENAIRHGVAKASGPGSVTISARRDKDMLLLSVSDDGTGIAPGSTDGSADGIGLRNTRERLQHLYGANFTFDLSDGPQRGAVATLQIPYSEDTHEVNQ